MAFASEKKPLWELFGRSVGIQRILPGQMLTLDAGGFEAVQFWSVDCLRTGPMITDRDKAVAAYDQAFRSAMHKRIQGRERVGIIFSGGIDSVLVAYLVRESGLPFSCYAVGCGEDAPDLALAREVAPTRSGNCTDVSTVFDASEFRPNAPSRVSKLPRSI